jgi:hypothetical protein
MIHRIRRVETRERCCACIREDEAPAPNAAGGLLDRSAGTGRQFNPGCGHRTSAQARRGSLVTAYPPPMPEKSPESARRIRSCRRRNRLAHRKRQRISRPIGNRLSVICQYETLVLSHLLRHAHLVLSGGQPTSLASSQFFSVDTPNAPSKRTSRFTRAAAITRRRRRVAIRRARL